MSDRRIDELEAMVASLTDRLQRLEGEAAPTTTEAKPEPKASRRQLLKLAGAAAVGAAAAPLASAAPASADGPDVLLGNGSHGTGNNAGGAQTSITANPGAVSTLNVINTTGSGSGIYGLGGDASLLALGGGVIGDSFFSPGVGGGSAFGAGVRGESKVNYGVEGAGRVGMLAGGRTRNLEFDGISGAPRPIADSDPTHGAVYQQDEGTLWFLGFNFVRKLASPITAGQLHVLHSPVRVYDSRPKGTNPAATGDGPLGAGNERSVSLANGFVGTTASPAVPVGATAALFTLTIVNTGASGFLAAFSNAVAYPGTSNIDWFLTNSILATRVTSAVDSAAKVKLHCGGTPTDFVIDVTGYYE
jgi:hypothetical protein